MKLQEAKDIKLGSTSASKVMLGNTQVWPKKDNNHLFYGEVVDSSQPLPTISLDNTVNTPTLDASSNMFYLDNWSNASPTKISFDNKINIKSINKMQLDTSNVTGMRYMFDGCSALMSLDLSKFNTSNVTDMYKMFYRCSKLTSLDLSNFDTSKVTNMDYMFNGCSSLTSLDLSNWDTSKVNSMKVMFNGCSSLKDVYITEESTLNKLTNNLKSEGNYFIPSTATIHYNGVDYKWQNSDFSKWTISDNSPVLYGEVVDQSKALPTVSLNGTTNTPKLYTPFNIFHLDTWSNASPTSITFNNKSNIKSIRKIQIVASSVTDMSNMLDGCSKLITLNLSKLNTSNVTNMSYMFNVCSALKSLDLSNWDISKVTNMDHMFTGCSSLKDVYITSEATLSKLTGDFKLHDDNYIPSSATIHYNGKSYTWFNNIWGVHIIIEA